MAGDKLTEDEAKLYDRQIRLWGVEAQNRMKNSRVLVVGLRGLNAEVTKNIVLSGIGTLHMLDSESVTARDLAAQFFLSTEDIGKNRAEANLEGVRSLNGRVVVVADPESVESKPPEFFTKFEIVCLSDCSLDTMIRINKLCREAQIPVFAGILNGFYGFAFMDHNQYQYKVSSKDEDGKDTSTIKTVSTPSFEDLFNISWNQPQMRRVSKLFFAQTVLFHYTKSPQNIPILEFKNEFLKQQNVQPTFLEDSLVEELWRTYKKDLSPVAAVVGGIVAQEIIKILSGKDEPILNCFIFDGTTNQGVVEFLTQAPPKVTPPQIHEAIEL